MSIRQEKVRGEVMKYAAGYIETESNGQSLITVTNCTISSDLKKATIFITVFPVEKEHAALDFLKRKRGEMRDYIKKYWRSKVIPFLEIEVDAGEKNRQHIEEISREVKDNE